MRDGRPNRNLGSKLWASLTTPASLDPDAARQEYTVKVVIATTTAALAVFTVLYALLSLTEKEAPLTQILTVAGADLLTLASLVVTRSGHFKVGGWILAAAFLLLSAFLTYGVGVWSPAGVFIALTLVLTFTLQGTRGFWLILFVCLAAYTGAGWAHGDSPLDLLDIFITVGAPFAGIALLMRLGSRQLQTALDNSRTVAAGLEREVVEHRGTEVALRESIEKVRALFESIPDGIAVLDLDGRIVDFNNALARLLDLEGKERFIGRDSLGFIAEADRGMARSDYRRLRKEKVRNLLARYRLRTTARHEVDAQLSGILLRNAAGAPIGIVATVRDITVQLELEAQLRQAQKIEAIFQLAGGVAHDFNNLLVGIQGFVDLSLQDLEEGHPAREHMQEVLAASDKAGALVRQLLAFSRSEAMRPQVLGINEVIQGLRNMLTHLVGEHIVLELAFGTDLRGVVGDARQLEQVILNLCVNSRDATAGGGRIVIETANATLDDAFVQGQPWALQGDFVLIRVSDNGAGMPEDVKEHLFEPFFTTKGPGQGTGMGLATVYSIVKQHHGLIHCESAPGVGTRFSVYLPVAPAGTAAAAAPGALADPAGGDETVLLVEDNEIVRRLACRVLRRAGYRILEACDGEAAMRVFRANASEVDLALIDVVMPGMSGRAVAENIRARNPSLPILFSSGYDFRLLDDALRDWEHTEIVHKPYHPKELLRRVRDALDAKGRDDG